MLASGWPWQAGGESTVNSLQGLAERHPRHPWHHRDTRGKEKLLPCPYPSHSLPGFPISMSRRCSLETQHDDCGGSRGCRLGPRDQV